MLDFTPEHYHEIPQPGTQNIFRLYKSPECWSGEGQDFSPWYTLTSAPPPDGYGVSTATFKLVGDRNCQGDEVHTNPPGAYCECQQVAPHNGQWTLGSRYKWRFRMQGHTERQHLTIHTVPDSDGSLTFTFRKEGGKATSLGILTVLFVRL